jgi:hypothetical protein
MISKKIRLSGRSNSRLIRKKLDAECLSSEIDALVRCTQARINLFRGFSELKAQLGIDDKSQQLNMIDEGISSYTDPSKPTQ